MDGGFADTCTMDCVVRMMRVMVRGAWRKKVWVMAVRRSMEACNCCCYRRNVK